MIICVFKKHENFFTMKIVEFFLFIWGAGAGAGIFDKLEQEPETHKNAPAPQHCLESL
jgi:hypothetical protein